MSVDTVSPIESTVHTTNRWLHELMVELDWDDPMRAYRALRVVLHALRDRLTVAQAVELGAQLPMLVRGLYYEGWTPEGKPVADRSREGFLGEIASAYLKHAEVYPEVVAWAVLKVLQGHVSAGEIKDVKAILPAEIRALWPRGRPAGGA